MKSDVDENFMLVAIKEAIKAQKAGDLPFGAVVVCKDKIVGKGKCENNTSGDVTDHAELIAIRAACKNLGTNDLKNCSIYCSNEPCVMCAAGIFQAKIPYVVIGASRDDLKSLRPRKIRIDNLADDSGYEIKVIKGILKDQVLKLSKKPLK